MFHCITNLAKTFHMRNPKVTNSSKLSQITGRHHSRPALDHCRRLPRSTNLLDWQPFCAPNVKVLRAHFGHADSVRGFRPPTEGLETDTHI